MFDSLPGVFPSSQQNGVRTLWCPQSQLIQSDDFTTGLFDLFTSSLCESQSCNGQFGDFQHSHIVRDSSYDDNRFPGTVLADMAGDEADADGRTVDTRLKETFEDHFVEFGVGTTSQESVEFD